MMQRVKFKRKLFFYFVLFLILGQSCKEDDFLDGYNRAELFSEPTQQELNDVAVVWKQRDLTSKNYAAEQSVTIGSKGTVLKIVSFTVSGFKEYGALMIPASDKIMPVRMYVGGFGIDITKNSIAVVEDNSSSGDSFIFAFPALRGQSLSITINGTEYTSPVSGGEHCDAFDGAADDAIAFLNVIAANETKADTQRTAIQGGSRGATVALLVAERDARIKGAVAVAGPVDLITLTSTSENDRTYQCQFLQDLVSGSQSVAQARLNMIASSAIYFAGNLPRTQLHLAVDDKIVPISQGEELETKMKSIGLADRLEYFVYAGRDHTSIGTGNTEMNTRISQFLTQVLK